MENSGLRWRIQGVISPTSYTRYKGLLRKTNAHLFAQRQVVQKDKIWTKAYGKIKHVWLPLTLPEQLAIEILWVMITCTFG